MRSVLLAAFTFALLSPVLIHAQQGKKMDIEISSAVLKTAEWANFKYMEKLDLAQSGDQQGIKALLEFSGTVDGTEALQHATTCIELIPLASDEKMGSVISSLKPKLVTALKERFVLAQARTKKEELRKPLQEWAPLTWKALNGEKVVCNSCMHATEGAMMAKPPMAKNGGPVVQPTEGTTESVKQ